MQLRLHAFAYPNAPPQTVTVIVNDRESDAPLCASVPVTPDWQTVECTPMQAPGAAASIALELRFAYAQRPVDVGAGGDTRPLAAAIDWIRVSLAN